MIPSSDQTRNPAPGGQIMSSGVQDGSETVGIPEDAVVVRQSNWAWLWAAAPWVLFFGLSVNFDFISFGIFPMVLAAIVIVPRYLGFRNTAYILSNSHLIIMQGTIKGSHRIDVSLDLLKDVAVQHGMFGRSLGYTGMTLQLKDERIAYLRYVPVRSDFLRQFQTVVTSMMPEETKSGDED